ncbi:hypothetical protein RclHR1_30860002 [Rhizophagus clarus]|uniref:Uncharacterized protein n=1 Tax=Rhizophagus clarus TaxID=94130 RepID=A0A2Z6S0H4_9GLOM|nr:hypothetical protein RclHR1_30860002 [Rhizophagus clarus]
MKVLKPVNKMSTSGLTKRATKIASKISERFSEIANDFYLPEDASLLESMEFSIKDKKYDIYYGKENQVLKHKKEAAIVRAMDKHVMAIDILRQLNQTYQEKKQYLGKKISGDGRNVGQKVKHVMITFTILDYKEVLFFPEYHYTLILYPGSEEYNTLDITTRSLKEELWQLKHQGLIVGKVHWKFEFYFSSDWKFLIICLGFNFPTSHQKKPLFDMIDLENYLVDELHVMLRMTDRLWSLVIHEVTALGFFDIAREVIIKEMQ